MRISSITMKHQSVNTINKLSNTFNKLLLQSSSQQKIDKGHEDPVLAQKVTLTTNAQRLNEQYAKNVNDAKSFLNYTESVLTETSDILSRIKELTIQAASDTVNNEARQAIVEEVNQLIIALADNGNEKFNDKYIFAGTKTTTKPFELIGNPPTAIDYKGNAGKYGYNISEGFNLEINLTGDKVFKDMITELIELRDFISAGDLDKIRNVGLVNVNKNIDNTINLRTELGAKSNIADNTLNRIKSMDVDLKSTKSNLLDVNIAEVTTEIAMVQVSYQASLSVVSKLNQMSILNYM